MKNPNFTKKLITTGTIAASLLLSSCSFVPSHSIEDERVAASREAAIAQASLTVPVLAAAMGPEQTEAPHIADLQKGEAQGAEFFENAAFFGNSLIEGLNIYGGLGGDYFAATSASVVSVTSSKTETLPDGEEGTLLQKLLCAIEEKEYERVYILLGINEIGFELPTFISLYDEMMDEIVEAAPETEVYIISITPVTEEKSFASETFCRERVEEYNTALYTLAQERGFYYADLYTALAGEDGFLPAEDSTDGVHLTIPKYTQWADYLREHYAEEG